MIFENKFCSIYYLDSLNRYLYIDFVLEKNFTDDCVEDFLKSMEMLFENEQVSSINLIFNIKKGCIKVADRYGTKLNEFFNKYQIKVDETFILGNKFLKPFIKMYTNLSKKTIKFVDNVSDIDISNSE